MDNGQELPKIFISARTGFILRNLVLGDFIKRLRERARIVIAVQDPENPDLKRLLDHPNVTLVKFIHEGYPGYVRTLERLNYVQYWMFYVMIAVNPTESLKTYAKLEDGTGSRPVRAIQKSLFLFGKTLKALGLVRSFERYFLWHYGRRGNTHEWMEALREHKPDLVLSTLLSLSLKYTPSDDLPMVLAAHKLGIKTSTLIQSWDNLATKPTVLPEWLDKYFTWSETQTKELRTRYPYIRQDKILAVGSPQFDFHVLDEIMTPRTEYVSKLGLDPAKPYLLIGTGTPKGMQDEIDKVMQLIRRLVPLLPDMQFVIRLHPKDYSNRHVPYLDELPKLRTVIQQTTAQVHMDEGGFVPPLDFYRDQVNVLRHSEVVLNTSSTLSVDAAIVDKPIVCLAYDLVPDPEIPQGRSYMYSQSDHYKKLADSGGVWLVRSEDECIEAIKQYMQNPQLHKQKRRELAELVTLTPDGGAAERLVDAVFDLLKENNK